MMLVTLPNYVETIRRLREQHERHCVRLHFHPNVRRYADDTLTPKEFADVITTGYLQVKPLLRDGGVIFDAQDLVTVARLLCSTHDEEFLTETQRLIEARMAQAAVRHP